MQFIWLFNFWLWNIHRQLEHKNWDVWMWSIQTTGAKENWDVMKALRSFSYSNFKEHAILKKAFSFWPAFLQRYLTWGANVNMLSIRQLVINNVDKSLIYFILFLWNFFRVEKTYQNNLLYMNSALWIFLILCFFGS